jgi:hypothetical protein
MPFVADGHYIAPGFMPLPGDTMGQRLCSLPPLGTAPVDYELPSVKEARLMQEHGEPWGPDLPVPDYPGYTAEDRARDNGIAFNQAEEHSRELLEMARNYASDVPEPESRLISEQPGYEGMFVTAPNGRDVSVLNPPRENLAGVVGVQEKPVSNPVHQQGPGTVQNSVPFYRSGPRIDLPAVEPPSIGDDCLIGGFPERPVSQNINIHIPGQKRTKIKFRESKSIPGGVSVIEDTGRSSDTVHDVCGFVQTSPISYKMKHLEGHPHYEDKKKTPVKKEFSIIGAIMEEVDFWKGILS